MKGDESGDVIKIKVGKGKLEERWGRRSVRREGKNVSQREKGREEKLLGRERWRARKR